jgi:hypothetical protein
MVRVPGYITEMYCDSCEVRTEFICYVGESRPPLWSSGQSSWLQNGDVLCFLWGTNWIYICYIGIRQADLVAPSIRKKLAITSSTSGGRSVGIVRSRTQATEFSFSVWMVMKTRTSNVCVGDGYSLLWYRFGGIYVFGFSVHCFRFLLNDCTNKKTPWSESVSELYRPSDRRLSTKWLPTFCG